MIDPATGRPVLNRLAYGQVAGSWMIGGDYDITSANHRGSNSLANDEERGSGFGRVSFEIADWLTVYGQASISHFEGLSYYQQTPSTGVSIRSDNAFLPAELYDPTGATTYTIGTSNAGIQQAGARNERTVGRYVVGGEGDFDVGAMGWSWSGYYQHGRTETKERLVNTWLNSRLAAQQDAVFDGSGNIVCRVNIDADPANDLPGCVPLNRIGIGGITGEALGFLFAIHPEREQYITQDVVGLNFVTGDLFDNWAGPVSLAFGAEYREEAVDGKTDDRQYLAPNDFWLYGNYRVTRGSYNVKEAYLETLFPLWEGLDFNGAVRVTDYSTSGTVTTWKAGLTFQPIDDIRFRATYSRDIRAPNLSELFDPGTARTNAIVYPIQGSAPDAVKGQSDQFVQNFTGNVDLVPEKADTLGIGVVATPGFAPGLSLAVDYFDIKVNGAIDTIGAQTTVNLCFEQNQPQFCDNINYVPGSTTDIQTIDITYYNFASQTAEGIDFEASYRRPLGPGALVLRGLATYYIENVSDNGIDAPNDIAGVNAGGGIPTVTYRVTVGYDFDAGFSALFVGRGFGDGVYDNDYIECTAACPGSGPVARTINENDIHGIFYLDASFTYDFDLGGVRAQALFAVKNLFDRDPVLIGNGPDGNNTAAYPQTNRSLYDTFGRTFRLGMRVRY